MFKKSSVFLIASVGVLGAVYGCSSSSSSPSHGTTGDDSGVSTEPSDSGTPDTSTGTPDTGGGSISEDAGTCPGPVTSADVPTYAATTQTLGDCTAAQIAGFLTACDSATTTQATCDAWFNATANTTCGNCIEPTDSNGNGISGGPTLVNPTTGDPLLNTAGCVAIEDTAHGTACAAPLANYAQCEDVACGQCPDTTTGSACQETTSTGSGACASDYSSFISACASDVADGGVASPNGGECQDPSFVFTLYCGGGDGGTVTVDAGDGG